MSEVGMIDREKVIKGLECCVGDNAGCDGCTYPPIDTTGCHKEDMMRDALELLKSDAKYIAELEEGIPFEALHTQAARIKELEELVRRIDREDIDRWGGRSCD